jgi:hypothetical protein
MGTPLEARMDIQVPKIDGRTRKGGYTHPIIDGDTGKVIGTLRCHEGSWGGGAPNYKRYHSRTISLIDDKYRRSFETHDECVAFAKGVEAVINRLAAPKNQPLNHPSAKGYTVFTVVEPLA